MGATAWVLLAGIWGATPAAGASGATRVVLLPAPDEASEADRELWAAVSAQLAGLAGVTAVSADQLGNFSARSADDALPSQIDTALARVQDAYRRVDVEEAARVLQTLENAQLSQLGCPERIALAAKISFWLGVVYAARKDTVRATERFSTVLATDPGFSVDSAYFSPQTVALFEKVRRGLSASPTGGLSLSAEPEGASVFLDGRAAGQTPITLTAFDGDHFVCVRRLGWKDWAARLHVTAGKVDTQRIYLQRASPGDLGVQLRAVFGGKSPRLEEPAHVDALGAVLGVDVVARLDPPATLSWREVRSAAEPHDATATEPEASADEIAAEVVSALGSGLRLQVAEPERSNERFDLEVTPYGGAALSFGRGGFVGARLGLWFNALPSLGVGLRAAVAKAVLDLPLFDPNVNQIIAFASGQVDAPLSLELRWSPLHTPSWRVALQGAVTLRVCTFNAPIALPTPPGGLHVQIVEPRPITTALLGPHLGLTAIYAVLPKVALMLGVDYGYEFALSHADFGATLSPPTGPPTSARAVSELARQALSFELGVQIRL